LVLGALLAFVRADRSRGWRWAAWWAASLGAFAAALLSKESACTAVGLVALVAWWIRPPQRGTGRWLAAAVPYAAIGVGYLGLRLWIVGSLTLPTRPSMLDNPLAHATVPSRIATAAVVLFEYLSQLFLPLHLSADYSYNEIPLIDSAADPRLLLALGGGLLLVLVVGLAARRVPALGMAALFAAVPLSLTANVLFPIGTIKAERLLYLPSVGWCLAAGWFGAAAWQRHRRAAAAVLVTLLAAYGARTVVRNRDWRDDLSLFGAAVQASPNSAKAHYNLGVAYDKRGDTDAAMLHLRQALQIHPGCADAALTIGTIYEKKGLYGGALHWYARTLQLDWSLARAHLNTGSIRYQLHEYTAAEAAFRSGLAVEPRNPRLQLGLGLALRAQNRPIEARLVLDGIDAERLTEPGLRDSLEQARLTDGPAAEWD
jgi:tetratricopeptide (TPR) repeat protein